jgi:hypothetical protein
MIKRLNYLDDAESTEMPQMMTQLTWKEVKEVFIAESIRLAKNTWTEETGGRL